MENTINSIKKEINEFAALLALIKTESETVGQKSLTYDEAQSFIKKCEQKYFHRIDGYFARLWDMLSALSPDSREEAQVLFKDHLLSYFHTPPLNQRIIDKPLGYDGDYLTIGYYYRNGYEGDTLFDKLMHRYTLHIPLAQSVIFRFAYFSKAICDAYCKLEKGKKAKVTSLGCGPAVEMLSVLDNHEDPTAFEFNCVDSDTNAIEQVKSNLHELSQKRNLQLNVNLLNMNVLKFIKSSRKNEALHGQHLIYAAGLFDYLNAKTAKALINASFALLSEQGKIIITNFHKNVPSRAYLENIGGWFLLLRDKEEMLALCSGIADKAAISVAVDPETKTNLYLVIQKK